jgi:hypothetical protein
MIEYTIPLAPCGPRCTHGCCRRRRMVRALLVSLGLLAACRGEAPPAPDAETVQWRDYHASELGVSLRVPSSFDVDEQGPEVSFRSEEGPTAFRLVWVTEQDADERGLWAGHDGARATLAGHDALLYDYDHADFGRRVRTIAYVVPWRERYLGLEFRTDEPELPPVYRSVLESVRFDGES